MQVHFVTPLLGHTSQSSRADEARLSIGGFRRCADAVDRLPFARSARATIRMAMETF